ncbi:hypothetical protein RI103_08395 [Paraburkholderia sp. FT54]|uniref:hypothetical protein n=1 Tax=Paraburkholderia sp. FT54 TaxID=3074437 RepID=UPI002877DA2B|nr:hypothetical protein [Paraburkholderia sp. FT54]WNC91350.1 hypothetical protein RI103_08395 [Paraburkholderia sp. FT54]
MPPGVAWMKQCKAGFSREREARFFFGGAAAVGFSRRDTAILYLLGYKQPYSVHHVAHEPQIFIVNFVSHGLQQCVNS